MDLEKFEKIKYYSEGSGVIPAVDSRFSMELNELGIYEEVAAESIPNEITSIEKVSPNFNNHISEDDIAEELYGNIPGIRYDNRLGYYSSLYVGYVKEGNYREKASSGGMGTWILSELFEKQLVDKVIHVKKVSDPKDNRLFKYEVSTTLEEIQAGTKTRYYPVELSEVLEIVKNQPGNYAIVGVPSFVMAIRLLAKYDETVNERIKYTVGIICGHQKSSKFTDSLALQMGVKPEDIIDIDYRKKVKDVPANKYSVEIKVLKENEVVSVTKRFSEFLESDWGQGLFKVRASDFTDDVFNETADITLGDAWLPGYKEESMGNNVVIVRNSEIDSLIKNAVQEERLKMDSVDSETIFSSQSSHYTHTHDEISYRLFKNRKRNEWIPQKRVAPGDNLIASRKKIQDLREELSTKSHLIFREAAEKNNYSLYTSEISRLQSKYSREYKIQRVKEHGILESLKRILRIYLSRIRKK